MDLYDKKNVLSFCATHCIPITDTIHKTQIPRKDVNQTCSISKKNLSSQNIHIFTQKEPKDNLYSLSLSSKWTDAGR